MSLALLLLLLLLSISAVATRGEELAEFYETTCPWCPPGSPIQKSVRCGPANLPPHQDVCYFHCASCKSHWQEDLFHNDRREFHITLINSDRWSRLQRVCDNDDDRTHCHLVLTTSDDT